MIRLSFGTGMAAVVLSANQPRCGVCNCEPGPGQIRYLDKESKSYKSTIVHHDECLARGSLPKELADRLTLTQRK